MSTGRRAYDLLRGYVNRELDRIRGVEHADALEELEQSIRIPRTTSTPETPTEEDQPKLARRILGVSETDDFLVIRRTFERLDRRADPANFPNGSLEQVQAIELRRRVQWAYTVLTKDVPEVSKRFGSLEIQVEETPKDPAG